jgi:hypothetical protein
MHAPKLRTLLIAATLVMSTVAFADDVPAAVVNTETPEAVVAPTQDEAKVETVAPAPATERQTASRDASVNQPTPTPTDDPPSCTNRPSRRFRVALAKVLAEVARVVVRAQ